MGQKVEMSVTKEHAQYDRTPSYVSESSYISIMAVAAQGMCTDNKGSNYSLLGASCRPATPTSTHSPAKQGRKELLGNMGGTVNRNGSHVPITKAEPNSRSVPAGAPLPSVLVEPSVPAACASLLSLRMAHQQRKCDPSKGSLPMLATAMSLLESSGMKPSSRSVLPFTAGTPASLRSMPSASPISGVTSPVTSNFAGSASTGKRGSRFWDTVLSVEDEFGAKGKVVSDVKPFNLPKVMATTPITPAYTQSPPSSSKTGSESGNNGATDHMQLDSSVPVGRSLARQFAAAEKSDDVKRRMPTEDESSKMNIPCIVCGVRFRKPGHLNMHWRSVHATSSDSVYPGKMHVRSLGMAAAGSGVTRSRVMAPSVDSSDSYAAAGPSTGRVKKSTKSTEGRAYECPQCDARFRRGSDRNRHIRMVHSRERPFECKQCGNLFGRKSFLEAHILTVHEKRRPFRCECGAAFGQRSSLTRHARKIHGKSP